MPASDTTYTLDVDGQTLTFTMRVIDPAVVTGFGTDNGLGFPFVTASGVESDINYQLWVSPDLSEWTPAGAPQTGGVSGTATFTDPFSFDPTADPKRFYRIRYAGQ